MRLLHLVSSTVHLASEWVATHRRINVQMHHRITSCYEKSAAQDFVRQARGLKFSHELPYLGLVCLYQQFTLLQKD